MAEDSGLGPVPVKVPVVFIGIEDVPILYVNQFVLSFQPQEFILTMGQLAPPILLGSEEEQREQAGQLDYVPIKVVGRVGMNRRRLVDLIALLEKQLQRYDDQIGAN
jgi:hypothetical protein